MDEPVQLLTPKVKEDNNSFVSWLNVDRYRAGSERKLADDIINGTALAVSDGSYSEEKGTATASWIISTVDKRNWLTAGAISPGPSLIQSSYRAEMLGILGIMEELQHICNRRYITDGSCQIFCDGLAVLQVIKKSTVDSIKTTYTSCDLLSAIVKLQQQLPISLYFCHVKGHQDNNTDVEHLSIPSQLNVMMDTLAKSLLAEILPEDMRNLEPHSMSFILPVYNDMYIYQKFKEQMYTDIMTSYGHQYWISKERYQTTDIPKIDWNAQNTAMKSVSKHKQRLISKWCSGWLGTGKNMQRWNLRYKGRCIFCGQDAEDTQHVLTCSHNIPTGVWKDKLKDFDTVLIKNCTSFTLRKAIILELRAWRNKLPSPNLHFADEELLTAIIEQRRIGWRSFLEGLITHSIIQYQHKFYLEKYPTKKGTTWAKKTIKAGWHLITEIWQYRNDTLHQPKNLDIMEGKEVLDKVVLKEWDRGLKTLPILEFSHLFRVKKSELMKKSTDAKKDWLYTVKMGRFLHKDPVLEEDEFDTNVSLRKWIGLPPQEKQTKPTKKRN